MSKPDGRLDMNQDNFFKACTTPCHKTLIGGSSGGGKSCLVLDMAVKFLHGNYRQDLDSGPMNELHSILNDQVPVVILTEDNRFSLLLRLSENCLPNPDLSDEEKVQRIDNLCRIHSPNDQDITEDWLVNLGDFLRRHQTKLIIIDGSFTNLKPELLVAWAREYNLAIVQTVQNRRSAPGYSNGKQFAGPINHMTTSDLAVMLAEPIKNSSNYLKFEVTLLKNRFGMTSDKEFFYECSYSPY